MIDLRAQSRVAFLLLLFVMVISPSCTQTINYPAPTLKSISPTNINAAQPQFVLKVMGSNLVQQTAVQWSGSSGTVTIPVVIFVSTNELDATIPASLIQNPGTVDISVTTPTPGGGTSPSSTQQPIVFTINPINSPIPQITSISPTVVSAGSGSGFTLFITGKDFVSQSTVSINNNNRTTTYINSTTLQASVTSADIANPGSLQIAVTNPPPGGGTSNAMPLSVQNPIPTVTTVAPVSATAGSADTTITITGANFVNGFTTITLNGVAVPSSIVSSTEATAVLPASRLLQAGVEKIVVVNQGPPGGGDSDPLIFSVNPKASIGLPVLVDLAPDGTQAVNGVCGGSSNCQSGALGLQTFTVGPSVSSNGQFVAYASVSHNVVTTDLNPSPDIFLRNTCLQTTTTSVSCTPSTTIVSTDPYGKAANGASSEPSISDQSATPGFGAFTSTATNLQVAVPVNNSFSQVYWRPLCTSTTCSYAPTSFTTQLVSVAADGLSAGNGPSYNPVVSADGEYVAFVSLATNLVSNVAADGVTPQVYVHVMCNGAVASSSCAPLTYLVSSADGTTPGNAPSSHPSISDLGLFVSFTSTATNLGATAPNPSGASEIFERSTCVTTIGNIDNSCAPETLIISTPDGTTPADGSSTDSSISHTSSAVSATTVVYNGRFVAFASTGTNLVPGAGPVQQIYVRDTCIGVSTSSIDNTCTPSTALVSTSDGTTPGNGASSHPSVSADAQVVAFSSLASNFANTTNGVENIFARNTCLSIVTTCTPSLAIASISQGTSPSPSNGASLRPSVSADGQTVGFLSFSNNLVTNDTNGLEDIFLASTSFTTTTTVTGVTEPVSATAASETSEPQAEPKR